MYLLFVVSNYGHGPSTAKQEPFRRHVILARDLEEAPLPLSFLQLVKNFLFTFPLKRKRKLEFTNFRFPTLFPAKSKHTKKPSTKTTVSNFYFEFLCGKRKWRSDKRFHKFFFENLPWNQSKKRRLGRLEKAEKSIKLLNFPGILAPSSEVTSPTSAMHAAVISRNIQQQRVSEALTLPCYHTLELSFAITLL